jgi:4-amino-4-deoxy-L-arabinose transferase-like glycosyltransferase
MLKATAVLCFVLLFGVDRLFWSDSALYRGLGEGIFRGEGFASVRFMPLYPTLLGLFLWIGGSTWGGLALSLVQAALAASTALILVLIARRFISSAWAVSAGLFFALEPFLATIHVLLIPETVFIFFAASFLLAFILYIEYGEMRHIIGAAIGATLALYTKPALIYFLPVVVILLLVWRHPKQALIFFTTVTVLMAPWMVRNKSIGGSFDITSDDAGNICSWGLIAVLSTKHRLDSSDWNQAWALPEYRSLEARCASVGDAARIFLLEYPAAFATTIGVSTLSLLTNEGYSALLEKSGDEQIKRHHNYLTPVVFINHDWRAKLVGAAGEFSVLELLFILLGKLMRAGVFLFACFGCIALLRNRASRRTALFMLLFVLYFTAVTVISTGFGVGARLRYPIELPLLLFALFGISLFVARWRQQI